MKIWLITIGEPLPLNSNARLHRAGILSKYLNECGHDVTWWSSTFDHVRKKELFANDVVKKTSNGINLRLLNGGGYKKNISFSRIRDHRNIAKKFSDQSNMLERPDLIISSYPTIELCNEAVAYGLKNEVPVIIDIRDLWPDIFYLSLPQILQPFGRYFIELLYGNMVKNIIRNAQSIVGISQGYLDWSYKKFSRPSKELDKVFYLGYEKYQTPSSSFSNLTFIDDDFRRRKKLVFAGTFGKTYDLSIPIEAARKLNNDYDSPIFIFCGTGEKEDIWKEKASNLSNVIFTGWLEKHELSFLLNEADAGLACYVESAPQGIPNKVIEYLSFNLPILSNLEGESEKLINEYELGLNYRSGNIQEFLEKLEKILQKDNTSRMSKNCESIFNKKFNARLVYGDYLEFAEKVVHEYKRNE